MIPHITNYSFILLLGPLGLPAMAQRPPNGERESSAPQVQEEVSIAFTEGPVWHPEEGVVYFSDVTGSRILRFRPGSDGFEVYRYPSGRSNGLLVDRQGRLVCCEGGGASSARRVTRIEPDGTIAVLAEGYEGRPFNSPNDLAADRHGRIYFTDPRYGDRGGLEQRDDQGRVIEGVYRIDGPGQVVRVLAHEVQRPNGIAVSPDGRFLYVADNRNDGPRGAGGNRKLWRFELANDGSVDASSRHLMFDWEDGRGPDGMAVDVEGTLYVAAGRNRPAGPTEAVGRFPAAIYVIDSDGALVKTIPVPVDMVTNCTFGGPERRTLYVTAGDKLLSVPNPTPGFAPGSTPEPEAP